MPESVATEPKRARQPNGLAGFLASPRWRSLVDCICPTCDANMATIAAGGGPVPIRHTHDRGPGVVPRRCRGLYVAVPSRTPQGPSVELLLVKDAGEQDRVLREQTESWGKGLVREIANAARPLTLHRGE